MVDTNPNISIITLKVSGLNEPIKRQILSEWIKKQDTTVCCLQETYFIYKDTYRLIVNGWRKIYHTNPNQKKVGVAILIADRPDLKVKKFIRDKEGNYIMLKGSVLQEDTVILNMYVPNNIASKY